VAPVSSLVAERRVLISLRLASATHGRRPEARGHSGGTLSGAGGTDGAAIGSGGSGLIFGSGGQTSPSGGTPSTGGVQTGSGGQNAGGGASALGGAFASGGVLAVGGAFGTGGGSATGGAQNTGGQASGGSCVVQKLWATGFAEDPTQVDADTDNIKDWRLRDGSTFQESELDQGVWHATPHRLLSTNPPNAFSQRVLVDIRLRHPGSENDSVPTLFWINVASDNPPVASIAVEVRHVGGSQTNGTSRCSGGRSAGYRPKSAVGRAHRGRHWPRHISGNHRRRLSAGCLRHALGGQWRRRVWNGVRETL